MKKNQDILNDFPEFFKDIHPLNFSVPDGWTDIVYELCAKIKKIAPDTKVGQIKEKFGGLRFYLNTSSSNKVRVLIDDAENKSFKTCEICGEPGKIDSVKGWLLTLCPKCTAKRK